MLIHGYYIYLVGKDQATHLRSIDNHIANAGVLLIEGHRYVWLGGSANVRFFDIILLRTDSNGVVVCSRFMQRVSSSHCYWGWALSIYMGIPYERIRVNSSQNSRVVEVCTCRAQAELNCNCIHIYV